MTLYLSEINLPGLLKKVEFELLSLGWMLDMLEGAFDLALTEFW